MQSSKNNKTPKHKTIQKLSDGFNAEFTIQKTVDDKVEIVFTEGLEELGLKCQTTGKIMNGCESIKDEVHYIVFNFMATSFYEDR